MSASIPSGVHTIKLGTSFQPNADEKTEFHTVRYDFKPASIEDVRESFIEFGEKNNVKVYAPKLDESHSITDATLFAGNSKAVNKDCVLIYDDETGGFVLELVSSNINLKKSRDPVSADKIAAMKSFLPNFAAKHEEENVNMVDENVKAEDEFMESDDESDEEDGSDESSSDSSSGEETAAKIEKTLETTNEKKEKEKDSPKSKAEKPSTIQLRKDLSLSDSESD